MMDHTSSGVVHTVGLKPRYGTTAAWTLIFITAHGAILIKRLHSSEELGYSKLKIPAYLRDMTLSCIFMIGIPLSITGLEVAPGSVMMAMNSRCGCRVRV